MNRQWPITRQYRSITMFFMAAQRQGFQNHAYTRSVCRMYAIHLFMEYEILHEMLHCTKNEVSHKGFFQ